MDDPRLTADNLCQFHGGGDQCPLWLGGAYTEGVRHLAERRGAYWLIDAVSSHRLGKRAKAEEFQHWILLVQPDRSATLAMKDGNDPNRPIITQEVEFTDYANSREDRCELYLVQAPRIPLRPDVALRMLTPADQS